MSLWDMINFNNFQLMTALHLVHLEEFTLWQKSSTELVDEEVRASFKKVFLPFVREQCVQLKNDSLNDRIRRIEERLNGGAILYGELYVQVKVLRESVLDGCKRVYCYHYPLDRADNHYWKFDAEWGDILKQFKSVEADARQAVDCYCLDQNTASVFHSMRVAEIGLRALAKERKVKFPHKPLEWAHWQEIISSIRGATKKITNAEAGSAKDEALMFYSGALGEFEAFKDVYRNQVMHVREQYDSKRAAHTLNHVREFMKRLSSKIGEDQRTQIKWGLRFRDATRGV